MSGRLDTPIGYRVPAIHKSREQAEAGVAAREVAIVAGRAAWRNAGIARG